MTERRAGPSKTRTKVARAQAMRSASEALERMRCGETMVTIFNDLTERGEIAMAYRTFALWMKRFSDDPSLLQSRKEGTASASAVKSSRPQTAPSTINADRTESGPVHVSMDFMAGAYKPKPPGHKPDMKKLIGPDYEEEF